MAKEYAKAFGVSEDEAKDRLDRAIGAWPTQEKLLAAAPDRLLGVWIEHLPDIHIVAAFAKPTAKQEAELRAIAAASDIPVDVRTDAPFTIHQLEEAREAAKEHFEPGEVGSYIDVMKGKVVIEVPTGVRPKAGTAKQAESQLRDALVVPIEVVEGVDTEPTNKGGHRMTATTGFGLPYCTSGFAVARWTDGATGVVTTGHCSHTLYYWFVTGGYTPTSFVQEARDAYRDFQWHSVPGTEVASYFNGGGETTVTGSHPRTGQLNQFACHYGQRTGWSCGMVTSIVQQPPSSALVPNCWNNQGAVITCAASYVLVQSGNGATVSCDNGDSGGPWVSGYSTAVAFGIQTSRKTTNPVGCVSVALDFLWDSGMNLYLLPPS